MTSMTGDAGKRTRVEVIRTGVAQPIEALGSMPPRAGIPLTDEQVEGAGGVRVPAQPHVARNRSA